jgi:hypothetical protein
MAQINFDPNDYEPSKGFDILPAGQYTVMITNSDIKLTKAGDGEYVWIEYTVLDGEHENRRLWSNHNVKNKNEEAEKIAKSEMSAICAACGIKGRLDDTNQLHDVPMRVGVSIRRGKDGYADQNQIRSWAPANATRETAAPAQQDQRRSPPPPRAPSAPPAKPVPAWKKQPSA